MDLNASNGPVSINYSDAIITKITISDIGLTEATAIFPEQQLTENLKEQSVNDMNNQYHEELLKNQNVESIIEDTFEENEVSFSQEAINTDETENNMTNDLKEFGVDTDEPDLFSNDNQNSSSESLLGSEKDDQEEDDLEIPAFLRRQKN